LTDIKVPKMNSLEFESMTFKNLYGHNNKYLNDNAMALLNKMNYKEIVFKRIANIRGIKSNMKYSPSRSSVFTLSCSINGRFRAIVLGDDTEGIPIYIESYTKDMEDEGALIVQEVLLVKWMREQGGEFLEMLNLFRGRIAILAIAKIGYYQYIEGDVITFRDFGVFDDDKKKLVDEYL
jgi:hypothetical protein